MSGKKKEQIYNGLNVINLHVLPMSVEKLDALSVWRASKLSLAYAIGMVSTIDVLSVAEQIKMHI